MVLKKHVLLLFTLLLISFFSMAGARLDSENASAKDSLNIHYFDPTHRSLTDSVVNFGKIFLKTPYHFGSPGVSSFDCSGFTSFVYRNFGYNLGHSSRDQAKQFDTVDRKDLKVGDLVFFSGNRKSKKVGHVGIVTATKGNGEFDFIHAAIHSGVTISNSNEEYYTKRYVKASRVVNTNEMLAIARFIEKKENSRKDTLSFTNASVPSKTIKKVIPAQYHIIKSGETLLSIAKKYDITVSELKRKNNIKGNKLSPNKSLLVKDEETVMVVQSETPAFTQSSKTNISGMSKEDQALASIQHATSHSVKKGETLFSISRLYNISVDQLKKFNKIIKGKIHPGQRLKVPQMILPEKKEVAKVEESHKTLTHKVLSGETLFGISKLFNIPVEELKKINNITDSKVHPGQELIVNQSNEESTNEKTNARSENKDKNTEKATILKVKKGETLETIAKASNTTVEELKRINNLKDSKLQSGQELRLNQATDDKTVVTEKIEKKPETRAVDKTYFVKIHKGETLGSIAKANNTTVEELRLANNLKGSKLQIGQELKINHGDDSKLQNTGFEKKADPDENIVTHKIKKGESLISIAKDNNISVEELKKQNHLQDSKIRFGQEIKISIPNEKKKIENSIEPKSKSIKHNVKPGETFYSIAKIYGCTVEELKNWNRKSGSKIKPGEKIVVLLRENS